MQCSVTVLVTNVSPETEYDIDASLRVDAMLYTGKLKAQIKKQAFEIKIGPESGNSTSLFVQFFI